MENDFPEDFHSDSSSLPDVGLSQSIKPSHEEKDDLIVISDEDVPSGPSGLSGPYREKVQNCMRGQVHELSSSDESDIVVKDDWVPLSVRLGINPNIGIDTNEDLAKSNSTNVGNKKAHSVALPQTSIAPVCRNDEYCFSDTTNDYNLIRENHRFDHVISDEDEVQDKEDAKELKNRKKAEALQKKLEKTKAREEKKLEKEREKLNKKVESQKVKNCTVDECMKQLKLLIDPAIIEFPEGPKLLSLLQETDVSYELKDQLLPCCITWVRQMKEFFVNECGELETRCEDIQENQVLVFIPSDKFLHLIHQSKQIQLGNANFLDETFLNFVRNVKFIYNDKRITFLVQGISHYFKKKKTANQKAHRDHILGNTCQEKPKRKRKQTTPVLDVNELDVEECMIATQVMEDCNVHLIECSADLAASIIFISKAIAKVPFRHEKEQSRNFCWMMEKQKSVYVQESGKGLLEAWQKQIEQFSHACEDTAKAIVSQYKSPTALLQAYENCSTVKDAENLLQDIQVRRHVTPLARTRRVGPLLSKKIYYFFTSQNSNLNLNIK